MMLPSHAHVDCILNGHRISQWADSDPPYEIHLDSQVEVHHGHDGTHYPMSSGNLGGRLTFKLVPHSVDAQWLLDREKDRQTQIINRLKYTEFNGTLQDVVTNIRLSLERGYLISTHRFPTAGMIFEAAFEFERMIPEYENDRPFSRFGAYPS